MAWDTIDLRTDNGFPLSDADREVILDVAGKAILNSDQDPGVVIRAAKRVVRKLQFVENLRAYATRAIYAGLQSAAIRQEVKDRPVCQYKVETIPDRIGRDRIENQLLVREALDALSAQDREIFVRRMAGDTGAEIDRDMNLKPRTAEARFRASKLILRQVLSEKVGRQTRSRGR
ncbi:MAG TPA: hypothetical protein VF283_22450 [Bryobacteraceae bacterium]|nr:hypothetical protein [Candidatus Acidoferrales bacterium]